MERAVAIGRGAGAEIGHASVNTDRMWHVSRIDSSRASGGIPEPGRKPEEIDGTNPTRWLFFLIARL